MTVVTIFFLGTFLLSGSAWLIQKPAVRPLLNTRRYYGLESGTVAKITQNVVVPGIHIPVDPITLESISVLSNNVRQNLALQFFAGKAIVGGNFTGFDKSDPKAFDNLQKIYLNDAITNKADLPPNYKYFGNGNVEGILKQLLLTNPFFTSALQYKAGGLAISSYAKNEDPTRYSKLITAYDPSFPRVNVKLNRNNLEVTEYKVYDASGNDITSKYKRDEALKLFLFTLTFYSEVIHASIHIYDYINVLGLLTSSFDSNADITSWAATYVTNVPKKYFEVETLLFSEQGALVSPTGFNSNRPQVLQYVVDELLKSWLHYSTADQFVNEFVFAYIPKRQRDGFLTEFRNQLNLIPDFTSELSAAVKTSAGEVKYNQINNNLEQYYRDIGNDISNIKDIGAWIQLMSAINIVHGSTFSFSRYIATPEFLPYRDRSKPEKYSFTDVAFAVTVLGTTFGLSPERYVFTSKLFGALPGQTILNVLQKYDKDSNDLKIKYFETIKKDPKFAEYGWLWTDYAPDLVDNKQLTIATYV